MILRHYRRNVRACQQSLCNLFQSSFPLTRGCLSLILKTVRVENIAFIFRTQQEHEIINLGTLESFFRLNEKSTKNERKEHAMKVSIDKELCTGCGLCAESVPDVFEMSDDDIAVVKIKTVKDALVDQVREASEDCPAEAIILEE